MTRAVTFTQAQVRRAVKAAESAGLTVRRVMISKDGSIVVDSGENRPAELDKSEKDFAASWDDL